MKIIIIFISILMILTTILKAEELKQSSNDPLLVNLIFLRFIREITF